MERLLVGVPLVGVALLAAALVGCGGARDKPVNADDLPLPPVGHAAVGRTIDADLGPVGFVSADAGTVAWSRPRENRLTIVARPASGRPATTLVRTTRQFETESPAADFDVGRGPDGRPVVVWSDGCDGGRRCIVRSIAVTGGRPRTIARLPARSQAPVSIDGRRLLYVQRAAGCDELHVLTVSDGSDVGLGRGSCGAVLQVDLQGDHAAAAASTNPPDGQDSFPSEAWLADVEQGGVRVVQREDTGYGGPDAIEGVALDGDALYTVRLGDQRQEMVQIPFADGSASALGISGSPVSVARDRNTTFVVDAVEQGIRSALVEYRPAR